MANRKSNWIKNFGKSVKYTGIEIISEMVPNTREVISSVKMAKDSAKDIKDTIVGSRSNMRILDTEINRTEISRKAKQVAKDAMKDIKNGTFSMQKIKKKSSSKDEFGMDDFSSDYDFGDEDISSNDSATIINNFSSNNTAMIDATAVSTEVISKTSLKSADLTVKGINAVSLAGFIKLNESLMQTNSILSNIDSNVSQMIEFYSDNVAVTNQAIMDTLQLVKEDLESKKKKDDYDYKDNPLDAFSNGLNLGAYKDYVKKNIKDYTSMITGPLEMFKMMNGMGMGDGMINPFKNPVQFLFKQGLKMMIPKDLKKSIGSFDAAIPKVLRRNLMNLNNSTNPIVSMFASIFGIKAPTLKKINLGNYYKDAVNWDGKSKKALEEVIPNLLNEIAKNTSKDDSYKGKTFDYDAGRFIGNEDMEKNLREKLQSSVSTSYFDMIDRVEEIFSSSIDLGDISDKRKKKIKDNIGKVFSDIAISNSLSSYEDAINIRSKKSVDKIIGKHNLDKKSIETVYKILGQFTPSDLLKYDDQNISAKDDLNTLLNDISSGNNDLGVYKSLLIDGQDSTKLISKLLKGSNFISYLNEKDKEKEEKMTEAEKAQKEFFKNLKNERKRFLNRNKGNSPTKRVSEGIDSVTNRMIDSSYNKDIEESDDLRNINRNYEDALNKKEKPKNTKKRSSNLKDIERGIVNEDSLQDATAQVITSTDKAMADLSEASSDIKTTFKQGAHDLYSMFLKPTYDAIFGKNGIISKIWNNDQFKNMRKKITKFLFGEKGDDKIYRDGLFSGVANHFLDGVDYIKYVFTGKGYTNRAGKTFKDNTETSVWSNFRKGAKSAYDNTMKYFFGEDYKNNKTYNKTFGAIGRFFSNIKKNHEENYGVKKKNAKNTSKVKNIQNSASYSEKGIDKQTAAVLGGKSILEVYKDAKKNMSLNQWINFKSEKEREINYIRNQRQAKSKARSKITNLANSQKKKDGSSEDGEAASDDSDSDGQLKDTERGIINQAAIDASNRLGQGISSISNRLEHILFGKDNKSDEQFQKEFDEETKKNFLPKFGKILTGGIAGASLVGLSGGSMGLLGLFLPSSLIGGAIVGIGAGLLSNSEKFQKTVFGEKDRDGKYTGGIISRKLMDSFNKAKPAIIGGAMLGALKSIFGLGGLPGPLGVLANTLLPGGPLGGAILGMGTSMLIRSERFQKLMFGEKDEDGKRHGGFFSKMLNKMSGAKDTVKKNSKYIKGGLKGALLGGVSAAVIGQMGLLGGALTLGGPVGGAIAGLSLGIMSHSDKFKNYLFGTQKFKDGKPIGREKDGLISRFANLFNVNVIQKLKDGAEEATIRFANWIKQDMIKPFKKAFGPVIDKLKGIKDDITDAIKGALSKVGEGIVNTFKKFLSPIGKFMKNVILKPLGLVTKGLLKITSKMTASLLSFPLKLLSGLLAPKRIATMVKAGGRFIASRVKNALSGTDENGNKIGIKDRLKNAKSLFRLRKEFGDEGTQTDIYNDKIGRNKTQWEVFRDKYIESQGMGSLGWHKSEEFRYDKKQGKEALEELKKKKKIHKQMASFVNEDSGDETKILDNKTYQKRLRKLERLGVDTSRIKSQQDLKEAMFHYDDWAKKPEETAKEFAKRMDALKKAGVDVSAIKTEEDLNEAEIKQKADLSVQDREKQDEYRDGVQNNFETTINVLNEIRDTLQGKIKPDGQERSDAEILNNIDNTLMSTQESTERVEEATIDTTRAIVNFGNPTSDKDVSVDDAIDNRKKDLESGVVSDQDSANIENLKQAVGSALTENREAQNEYDENKAELASRKTKEDKDTEEAQALSYKNRQSKKGEDYDEKNNKILQALLKAKDTVVNSKGSDILSSIFGKLFDLGVDGFFKYGLPAIVASLLYKLFKWDSDASLFDTITSWIKEKYNDYAGFSDDDGSRTDYDNTIIQNAGMQESATKFALRKGGKYIQKAFGVVGVKGSAKEGVKGLWQMTKAPFKTTFGIGKDIYSGVKGKFSKNAAEEVVDTVANAAVKNSDDAADAIIKGIKVSGKGLKYLDLAGNVIEDIPKGDLQKMARSGKVVKVTEGGSIMFRNKVVGMTDDAAEGVIKNISRNKVMDTALRTAIKNNYGDIAETATSAVAKNSGNITEAALKNADNLAKTGISAADNVMSRVAKEGAEAVSETASKNTNKVLTYIKNIFKDAADSKAARACGQQVVEALGKTVPDAIEKTMKNPRFIRRFAGKIADCAIDVVKGAAKVIPVLGQIWTIGEALWNAFTGWTDSETANLFGVSEDDVTPGMKAISALLKVVLGLFSVASIFDLVSEIVSAATNGEYDFKKWLATFLYKFLADEEDSLRLDRAQKRFDISWEQYNDEHGTNLSKDAYNDKLNQSVWDKLFNSDEKIVNNNFKRTYVPSYMEGRRKLEEARARRNNNNNKRKVALKDTIDYSSYDNANYNIEGTAVSADPNATNIEAAGLYAVPTVEIASAQGLDPTKAYAVDYAGSGDPYYSDNPYNKTIGYGESIGYGKTGIFKKIGSATKSFGGNAINKAKSIGKSLLNKSKSLVSNISSTDNGEEDEGDKASFDFSNIAEGITSIADFANTEMSQYEAVDDSQSAQIIDQNIIDPNMDEAEESDISWKTDLDQLKSDISSNVSMPIQTALSKITEIISKIGIKIVDSIKDLTKVNVQISNKLSNNTATQSPQDQSTENAEEDENGGFLGGLFKATNFLADLPVIGSLPGLGTALNIANTVGSVMGYGIKDADETESQNEKKEESIGYGPGRITHYSQYNSKYRNMPIGRLPNGRISTMATGGCGPTALAMAASATRGGNVNPASVASMAVRKGYMTQGGSSTALFDKGSKDLGLKSSRITSSGIASSLKSGKPVVLSGKSNSRGSAYSPVGHIVTATGMDRRGNVILHDPRRRSASITSLRNLKSGFKTGWTFGKKSIGYGDANINDSIGYGESIGYGNKETIKITAELDFNKRKKLDSYQTSTNINTMYELIIKVFNLTFSKIPEMFNNVLNSYGSKYENLSNGFMTFISKLLYLYSLTGGDSNSLLTVAMNSYREIESYINGINKSVISVSIHNSSDNDIANIFKIEKKYIDSDMKLCVKFVSEVSSLPFIKGLVSKLFSLFDTIMDWNTISNLSIFLYEKIVPENKKQALLKNQKKYENALINDEENDSKTASATLRNKSELEKKVKNNDDSFWGSVGKGLKNIWNSVTSFLGFGSDDVENDIKKYNKDSAFLRDLVGYGERDDAFLDQSTVRKNDESEKAKMQRADQEANAKNYNAKYIAKNSGTRSFTGPPINVDNYTQKYYHDESDIDEIAREFYYQREAFVKYNSSRIYSGFKNDKTYEKYRKWAIYYLDKQIDYSYKDKAEHKYCLSHLTNEQKKLFNSKYGNEFYRRKYSVIVCHDEKGNIIFRNPSTGCWPIGVFLKFNNEGGYRYYVNDLYTDNRDFLGKMNIYLKVNVTDTSYLHDDDDVMNDSNWQYYQHYNSNKNPDGDTYVDDKNYEQHGKVNITDKIVSSNNEKAALLNHTNLSKNGNTPLTDEELFRFVECFPEYFRYTKETKLDDNLKNALSRWQSQHKLTRNRLDTEHAAKIIYNQYLLKKGKDDNNDGIDDGVDGMNRIFEISGDLISSGFLFPNATAHLLKFLNSSGYSFNESQLKKLGALVGFAKGTAKISDIDTATLLNQELIKTNEILEKGVREYLKDGLYNVLATQSDEDGMKQVNALNGAIIYNQEDPGWKDFKIGKKKSIGEYGNILTSFAMGLTTLDGGHWRPDALYNQIQELSDDNVFSKKAEINWDNFISTAQEMTSTKITSVANESNKSAAETKSNIESLLLDRIPILFYGKGDPYSGSESSVFATGFKDNDSSKEVLLNDPKGGISRTASLDKLLNSVSQAYSISHLGEQNQEMGLEVAPNYFEFVNASGVAENEPIEQEEDDAEIGIIDKFIAIILGGIKAKINGTETERLYDEDGNYTGKSTFSNILDLFGLASEDDDEDEDGGSGSSGGSSSLGTSSTGPVNGEASPYVSMKVSDLGKQDVKYFGSDSITASEINTFINKKVGNRKDKSGKDSRMKQAGGQAFIDASKKTGIDPRVLVAVSAHESGWGCSGPVTLKNNFGGIGCYDSEKDQGYPSAPKWNTPYEGVIGLADFMNNDYYTANAKNNNKSQRSIYQMGPGGPKDHQWNVRQSWVDGIADVWANMPYSEAAINAAKNRNTNNVSGTSVGRGDDTSSSSDTSSKGIIGQTMKAIEKASKSAGIDLTDNQYNGIIGQTLKAFEKANGTYAGRGDDSYDDLYNEPTDTPDVIDYVDDFAGYGTITPADIYADYIQWITGSSQDKHEQIKESYNRKMQQNPSSIPIGKRAVSYMYFKRGKLLYSRDLDKRDPNKGIGDCSTTVAWAINNGAGKRIINPSIDTGTMLSEKISALGPLKDRTDIDGNGNGVGRVPNPDNLKEGDLLFYRDKDNINSSAYGVGHVEMYAGKLYGTTPKTTGHGGGLDGTWKGPLFKDINYRSTDYIGAKSIVGYGDVIKNISETMSLCNEYNDYCGRGPDDLNLTSAVSPEVTDTIKNASNVMAGVKDTIFGNDEKGDFLRFFFENKDNGSGGDGGSSDGVSSGNVPKGASIIGAKAVEYMKSKLGKLKYTKGSQRANPGPDGGWGDCSSTVAWALNKAAGKEIVPKTSWSGTFKGTTNGPTNYDNGLNANDFPWVDKTRGNSDTSKFKYGDIMLYDNPGHVDLYVGDGQVISHGNPSKLGPTIHKYSGTGSNTFVGARRVAIGGYSNGSSSGSSGGKIGSITPSSSLNVQQALLPNSKYVRPGDKLDSLRYVVMHNAASNKPVKAIDAVRGTFIDNHNKGAYASAHYGIGDAGEIVQMIPEDEYAYHSGAGAGPRLNPDGSYNKKYEGYNNCSIGIEICDRDRQYTFSNAALTSATKLAADICKRHNLDPKTSIIRHYDVNRGPGIGPKDCPHRWTPGNHPEEFEKFKSDIAGYGDINSDYMDDESSSYGSDAKLLGYGFIKADDPKYMDDGDSPCGVNPNLCGFGDDRGPAVGISKLIKDVNNEMDNIDKVNITSLGSIGYGYGDNVQDDALDALSNIINKFDSSSSRTSTSRNTNTKTTSTKTNNNINVSVSTTNLEKKMDILISIVRDYVKASGNKSNNVVNTNNTFISKRDISSPNIVTSNTPQPNYLKAKHDSITRGVRV